MKLTEEAITSTVTAAEVPEVGNKEEVPPIRVGNRKIEVLKKRCTSLHVAGSRRSQLCLLVTNWISPSYPGTSTR